MMNSNLRRIAMLLAIAAIPAATACSDHGPSITSIPVSAQRNGAERSAERSTELSRGGTISARVVATARKHDAASPHGRILAQESGTYTGAVGANGSSQGEVTIGGGVFPMTLAVDATVERRRGQWEQRARSTPGKPERVIRYTASGAAPVSGVELVQGGELVGKIATEWSRVGGAWMIQRRVITLYRDGAKARTIEFLFDGLTASGAVQASGAMQARASAGPSRSVGAPSVDASLDSGGDCGGAISALFDALDAYWAADANLSSCLAGSSWCFGAAAAVLYTSYMVGSAEGSLTRAC